MGCTQSVLPLWAATISFRRQIGLLGAFQGVIGTGLGDQLYQIFGAGWAAAGIRPRTRAATPRLNLRDFIKITPQTHVLFGETMSQAAPQHNQRTLRQKGVVLGGNFSPGRVWMRVFSLLLLGAGLLAGTTAADAQTVVTLGSGMAHECFVHAKTGLQLKECAIVCDVALREDILSKRDRAGTFD